jgi:sterol desaturase/sphingolipid hydroxylase (fatty acid hydroxylase superfamily)
MEVFHWLTEQAIALLSGLGIGKGSLKATFDAYGLAPLWALLRDLYLNPYYMLFAIPLWLLLGRIWPAEKPGSHSNASLSLDFVYPLLSLPIQATVVVSGAALINGAFKTYIPFLDTGLLNEQPILIQAIGAFLITDLMFYVAHVIKHKVPWLWYFHTVHHSQRYVNPLTTHRNHPFESLTDLAIKAVPIAIVGGSYPSWALFVLVNGMWGYYIHSNVRTNLGPLKYVLVTPQNHRLHHTIEPDQVDRNFGERLILWDWMFGTLYKNFDTYPRTGVKGCEWIEERDTAPVGLVAAWIRQFVYPFYMIAADVRKFMLRVSRPRIVR